MTVTVSPPTPATTFRVTTPTRSNARAWARKFEARLLEPGIVSYEDAGCGKAFLTKEDIEKSIHTFIGRPLILTPKLRHKRVTPADLEKDARGYITETYYNPADGWFWARGICHSDEAKDAIDRVGFCSCAYEVEKVGPGGEYHAIPYQEQIVQFSGEHLAIVDRPRYEGATIRLNSKTNQTNTTMFKWIKKIASRSNSAEAPEAQPAAPAAPTAQANPPAAEPTVKENSVTTEEISGETQFEIPARENGKTETVALKDLIASHRERDNGLSPEDHLEVDGKQVLVSELVAGYKANAAKTNAEEEDDEEKKKKAKENAAPAPAAPATAAQHFKVLMNARDNASALPTSATPDDLSSRCNRGAERYGKPGKN